MRTITNPTPKRQLGVFLVFLAIALFFLFGISFILVDSKEGWLLSLALTGILFTLGFSILWLDQKEKNKELDKRVEEAGKYMRELNLISDYFEAFATSRYGKGKVLPIKVQLNNGVWEAKVWAGEQKIVLYFDEVTKIVREKD